MHPSPLDYNYGPKIIRDWAQMGQDRLKAALKMDEERNLNVAKNLILFIGDGLGNYSQCHKIDLGNNTGYTI